MNVYFKASSRYYLRQKLNPFCVRKLHMRRTSCLKTPASPGRLVALHGAQDALPVEAAQRVDHARHRAARGRVPGAAGRATRGATGRSDVN